MNVFQEDGFSLDGEYFTPPYSANDQECLTRDHITIAQSSQKTNGYPNSKIVLTI